MNRHIGLKKQAPVPPPGNAVLRAIRSRPYVYSAMCRSLLLYSRYVRASAGRSLYNKERALFSMSEEEALHCDELRNQGFTVFPEFFDTALVDQLYDRVDALFKNLEIDFYEAYSVHNKFRRSLSGLTYHELERSEKMIALSDPLLNIPECVNIGLNVTFLKVTTNFLGYIPPRFKPMIVRDFPSDRPRESSNFHRDNDESDSVQVFVYLNDIDDSRGPLVYIPGTNRYDVRSCKPRLARDLGLSEADGRISDNEMEKYYPKSLWRRLCVKRGSAVIIHANGFHKGPSWRNYGDPNNKPRTALRFDFAGLKTGSSSGGRATKIWKRDFSCLTRVQRLFTKDFVVVD